MPSPSASSKEDSFENTLIQCNGDDDLPVIYRSEATPAPVLNGNDSENGQSVNFMLPDFEYKEGAKLFVIDDGDCFVPYTILQYDPSTTKAVLQDGGGMISSLVYTQ